MVRKFRAAKKAMHRKIAIVARATANASGRDWNALSNDERKSFKADVRIEFRRWRAAKIASLKAPSLVNQD